MTMQPRPDNPIEARKQEVRAHLRSMLAWAGGGAVAGLGVIVFATQMWWLAVAIVGIALVASLHHRKKIQEIVNYKDAD